MFTSVRKNEGENYDYCRDWSWGGGREKGELRAEEKYGANDDLFSAEGLSQVGVTTNVYSDHIWNDGKTPLYSWIQLSQLPGAHFIS